MASLLILMLILKNNGFAVDRWMFIVAGVLMAVRLALTIIEHKGN